MADPDYFTLAEFRALPEMDDATKYQESKVLAAASHFVRIVEREVFGSTGEGFIPRTLTQTFSGDSQVVLVLKSANVRSLTTVTVDGSSVLVADLSGEAGILRYLDGTRWNLGVANVAVTFSAGKYASCPDDVKDAVMQATRDRLISQASDAAQDPRQSSMTNDLGGTNQYVLPGEKRPTGYPELDALIASYARHTPSLGFA